MLTSVAVILLGFLEILRSQTHVTTTLVLLVGIVALVLALLDIIGPRIPR